MDLARFFKRLRPVHPTELIAPPFPGGTHAQAVHLMQQRLECDEELAIAIVGICLAQRNMTLSHLIDCLRFAYDIPILDIGLRQRVNRRFGETGAFVGYRLDAARPIACAGCRNYYGVTHGQGHRKSTLTCAIHPHGPESESCNTWEGQEDA